MTALAIRGTMNKCCGPRALARIDHEGTMKSGLPQIIGSPWASADTFRRSVGP